MLVFGSGLRSRLWSTQSGALIRLHYRYYYFFPFIFFTSHYRWGVQLPGRTDVLLVRRADVEQMCPPGEAPHLNPLLRFGAVASAAVWGAVLIGVMVAELAGKA